MIIYNVVIINEYFDYVQIKFNDFDKALAFVSLLKGELNRNLKVEIHEITDKQVKKIYEYGNY